ncbi:hypothetical protein QR680_000556 [Steinernema hermaphroditum]|uniref:Uncharacterized protein n=1 Tax=Steinernema hermaphroditum TaxID=289476 RepID=A0AA39GV10_9BILA|nr:hypothetical protein QR680_000556 [Steinernema hermaphroditum]
MRFAIVLFSIFGSSHAFFFHSLGCTCPPPPPPCNCQAAVSLPAPVPQRYLQIYTYSHQQSAMVTQRPVRAEHNDRQQSSASPIVNVTRTPDESQISGSAALSDRISNDLADSITRFLGGVSNKENQIASSTPEPTSPPQQSEKSSTTSSVPKITPQESLHKTTPSNIQDSKGLKKVIEISSTFAPYLYDDDTLEGQSSSTLMPPSTSIYTPQMNSPDELNQEGYDQSNTQLSLYNIPSEQPIPVDSVRMSTYRPKIVPPTQVPNTASSLEQAASIEHTIPTPSPPSHNKIHIHTKPALPFSHAQIRSKILTAPPPLFIIKCKQWPYENLTFTLRFPTQASICPTIVPAPLFIAEEYAERSHRMLKFNETDVSNINDMSGNYNQQ